MTREYFMKTILNTMLSKKYISEDKYKKTMMKIEEMLRKK